jgi:hypothetical protein
MAISPLNYNDIITHSLSTRKILFPNTKTAESSMEIIRNPETPVPPVSQKWLFKPAKA